jgi:hypothetical protein
MAPGEEISMRTPRFVGSALGLTLLLAWPAVPASAGHDDADWLDVRTTTTGTLDPMPDPAAPSSRQGHGTMMSNFEDAEWTWRATGSGSCTEINIDLVAVYPPRPGDWAKASVVAVADDAVQNFCVPGTRRFHGTGRITGGGGNYADSAGDFTFTGVVAGNGSVSSETIQMESTGRLRCYHVKSVDDRAEHHH